MKKIWLVLILFAGLFLTGCKTESTAIQNNASESSTSEVPCYYGACIKDIYSSVEQGYFAVFFDITPLEGIKDATSAPQFSAPLNIQVSSMDGTDYINDVFAVEDFYCYVGKDVPWAIGEYTSVCTISNKIEDDTIVPTAGDTIIITLPEYDDYQLEIDVEDNW